MRKWLFLLGLIVLVYFIFKASGSKSKEKSPFLKRVNETITILVLALSIAYVLAFLYWLYGVIFK
jgi:VIT1/CCC1 family predicted Fe2+/Mn2+ transporter